MDWRSGNRRRFDEFRLSEKHDEMRSAMSLWAILRDENKTTNKIKTTYESEWG